MIIVYSDYLLIPFGIFCIIFGIYIRKKQVALRFKRTGFQLNGKEIKEKQKKGISSLKQGSAADFLGDYIDYIVMITGVVLILLRVISILDKNPETEIYGSIFGTLLFLIAALSVAVCSFLINLMGKKSDIIKYDGTVVAIKRSGKHQTHYSIIIQYLQNGKEEFHSEACRYSQKRVPDINDKIVLLFSPKYEKILTKNERKKYRKITFWGFSIAVVFLLYLLHTIGVI